MTVLVPRPSNVLALRPLRRALRLAPAVCRVVVAGVLLFAGVLKLLDRAVLHEALAWLGFAEAAHPWVARGVGLGEAGLALLVLHPATSGRLSHAAVFLALLGFTGLLIVFALADDPQACGCLGKLMAWQDRRAAIVAGIGHNGLLLAMTLVAALPAFAGASRRDATLR